MLKALELSEPTSCFNKARSSEMLFVLLERDPAAPVAIRAWIAERIKIGKNNPDDKEIIEAKQIAEYMTICQHSPLNKDKYHAKD